MPVPPLLCNCFRNTGCHVIQGYDSSTLTTQASPRAFWRPHYTVLWFPHIDRWKIWAAHPSDCSRFLQFSGVYSHIHDSRQVAWDNNGYLIAVIFYLTDYLLVQRSSLFSNRITSRVQCWPLVAVETLIPTVLKMILCRIFLWLREALCLSFLIVRLKSFLKFKCQLIESYFR